MASELAKKYAGEWRKGDGWSADYVALVIDAAIRASHAQRTRRENAALSELTFSEGFNSDKVALVKRALRRARRGSK